MQERIYYPLTSPQLSIWYTEKMYPGTSIANVAGTLRIKDHYDFDRLEQAINLFIKNNDGIRLRITLDENGLPLQYISDYEYQHIEVVDFSNNENPSKAMFEWDAIETKIPFELLENELYKFIIIKLSNHEGGFMVKASHIISDGWSMGLLGSNIVKYYSYLNNKSYEVMSDIPEPSFTLSIHNDHLYKESNRFIKDKKYWEEQFEIIPESPALKIRKASLISTKSKRKTFLAPKKFVNKLRAYCNENRITPYPLFLSALAMYINRTSGKEDIIIGTLLLNRLNQTEKKTVGMFINTLPIRIGLNCEDSFTTFSKAIVELCSRTYRHQQYPYDLITSYVHGKHGFQENLCDIILSYQNAKLTKYEGIEYSTRWHFCGHQFNSLSININDRDDEGTFIIDYDYNVELFHDGEIEFIHQHIINLLWHALDNPQNLIYETEMISESEKRKILVDFNNTDVQIPRNKTIQQLFEEQVRKTPDNAALKFEQDMISYNDLNRKSNQLANVLRKKGVLPGQFIAIMAERSIELIIGILAIIKAGGAFMPVEPDYPPERIDYMIKHSNTKLVLTTNDLIHKVNLGLECVDILEDALYSADDQDNLFPINNSNDLLYLLYTSGSSGTPKGVMIEHKSLNNFVFGVSRIMNFNENSVVLSVTNICFDIFVFELFTSLLNGSVLVLANKEEQRIPSLLGNLIMNNNVSMILTTPTRIRLLIDDEKGRRSLANVKQIMLGGENLDSGTLVRLKKLTPAQIFNGYGPTEITIGATFKDVTNANKITIGRPISNTKAYILDNYKNLVPIGCKGELYISGEGLARGYINNKKLTDEVFIQNPFDKNHMLYKTGDIARWYPQGDIEFLGRKDNLVKLRGYRIELSEIENTILKYTGIKDAVVKIQYDTEYGEFLCAYYVSESKISNNALKAFIGSRLPRYMVPKFLMQIDSVPATNNGKRDIAKLPAITCLQNKEEDMVKPSNKIEMLLSDIFCKIMKIKMISTTSDIFELGADSLTVIQLISILDNEEYKIDTEDIYKNPTIKQLSAIISKKRRMTQKINKSGETITLETKKICELINEGSLPRLDSAALSYIPENSGISLTDTLFYSYNKTTMGNIGLFSLPITDYGLYRDKEGLLTLCIKAINEAKNLGARVISLTGLIPSATNYGLDIINRINSDIVITTGHATTAASVILSLERLMIESERNIYNEKISLLGIGSVGKTVAELLLSLYPNIKQITLCDLYSKHDELNLFKHKLKKEYHGEIQILLSEMNHLPDEIYESTLIIGATNVPNIIDVSLLKPGTLVLDDSGPHCFSKEHALERLQTQGDILFTEGGVLASKEPIQKINYIPDNIDTAALNQYYQHFYSKYEITGCILSSLLTAKFNELSPTIGNVICSESVKHYHLLKNNGFRGANLHCDNIVFSERNIELIKKFNQVAI